MVQINEISYNLLFNFGVINISKFQRHNSSMSRYEKLIALSNFCLSAIFITLSNVTYAQSKIQLSAVIAYDLNSYSQYSGPLQAPSTKYSFGLTSGLSLTYNWTKNFSITSGLVYSFKRFKPNIRLFSISNNILLSVDHHRIELPILASRTLIRFKKNKSIGIIGGYDLVTDLAESRSFINEPSINDNNYFDGHGLLEVLPTIGFQVRSKNYHLNLYTRLYGTRYKYRGSNLSKFSYELHYYIIR